MKKTIAAHYLETGILGAYETASADYEEILDGNYVLCFDDSVSHIDDTYATIHRTMTVEGRTFRVRSVFSADCGGTLVLHRAHTMKETQNNFMCSTYKKRGKEECSAHYIRETQLKAIVLDDLKRVTHYARQEEQLFAEHITRKNSMEARREMIQIQREIDTYTRVIVSL